MIQELHFELQAQEKYKYNSRIWWKLLSSTNLLKWPTQRDSKEALSLLRVLDLLDNQELLFWPHTSVKVVLQTSRRGVLFREMAPWTPGSIKAYLAAAGTAAENQLRTRALPREWVHALYVLSSRCESQTCEEKPTETGGSHRRAVPAYCTQRSTGEELTRRSMPCEHRAQVQKHWKKTAGGQAWGRNDEARWGEQENHKSKPSASNSRDLTRPYLKKATFGL